MIVDSAPLRSDTRSPWRRRAVLVIFWVIGLAFFTWTIPAGPRGEWSLPREEFLLGFLGGGRTLVTHFPKPGGKDYLRTRNEGTGALLREQSLALIDGETFFLPGADLILNLKVEKEGDQATETGSQTKVWLARVHIYDAQSLERCRTLEYVVPEKWTRFNYSPDGKKYAALTLNSREERVVRTYDLSTGNVLSDVPAPTAGPLLFHFLLDNQRLAVQGVSASQAKEPTALVVYDSVTGVRLVELPAAPLVRTLSRMSFTRLNSNDTNRLVHGDALYDATTGSKLCDLPSPKVQFTPDDDTLFDVQYDQNGPHLTYYDSRTGKELPERRQRLSAVRLESHNRAFFTDSSNRLFVMIREGKGRQLSRVEQWLAGLPYLDWIAREQPLTVFLDYPTKHILGQANVAPQHIAPDHTYFVTRGPEQNWQIWDLPPQRPWISLLLSWTVWSLFFWLIQNRIVLALR